MHKAIQDYCRIAKQNGHNLVLIEDGQFISIWRQKDSSHAAPVTSQSDATTIQASTATVPPKPERLINDTGSSQPEALSQSLIDTCKTALLFSVGPIAHLVFKEILAQSKQEKMSPIAFIKALANQVPNAERKQNFLQELLSKELDAELTEELRSLSTQ